MRIFLTGSTGLLGSHVAERLRGKGHEVVVLFRSGADTSFLQSLGCELAAGEVTDDSGALAQLMDGCGGVVHAAAAMYGLESLAAARSVNVEGTRRVLQGAGEAGVRQAVHISSVAVYGNAPAPVTEDDLPGNTLRESDTYARTKREAEEVVGALNGHGSMEITVLRPAALYGERDRWFTPRMVAQLRRGLVPLVGRGSTRFPAVYAGNAAGAVELALEGKGCGEVFNLGEDHEVTLRFLYERFARALGLEPRFVSIPASVARMGARVGETLGLGVPGARDLSLARIVRLVSEDNPYSSEKARTRLGWNPSFSLEESMARTGAWIREQKGWERVD